MAVSHKNCKHSKTEDKGLSFLCFIHYFRLISVTFLSKTALQRSLITVLSFQPIQLESLQAGYFFFFLIITLLFQRVKLAHQMFAQK